MKNVFVLLLSAYVLSAPLAKKVIAQQIKHAEKIEAQKTEKNKNNVTCKELVIRKCKENPSLCVSLIDKSNPFSTRTGNIPKEEEIKKIIKKRIWCKVENK